MGGSGFPALERILINIMLTRYGFQFCGFKIHKNIKFVRRGEELREGGEGAK